MSATSYRLLLESLAVAPAILVAVAAAVLWHTLKTRWLFTVTAIVSLYLLSAVSAVWLASDVGISGTGAESMVTSSPFGLTLSQKALIACVAWLIASTLVVWGLARWLRASPIGGSRPGVLAAEKLPLVLGLASAAAGLWILVYYWAPTTKTRTAWAACLLVTGFCLLWYARRMARHGFRTAAIQRVAIGLAGAMLLYLVWLFIAALSGSAGE